jgi:ubiquinone biosynthesis protein Coq4
VKQLVYISKASIAFTAEAVNELTEISSTNNKKLDVTGCMLFASGYFLQLLEGEDNKVDALYKKIEKDTRHKGSKILLDSDITGKNRLYEKWFMTSFNVDKMVDFPKDLKESINNIVNNEASAITVHKIFIEFKNYLAK